MDFLDARKKRAHAIRLFIGYGLIGILLFITTMILVFEARGYDVNRRTGEIIQNGLLFVDAHPETANIYLNGEAKGTTDSRMVLPAGEYTMELRREGYRSWTKTFNLAGSSIERLVYPFLFPSQLNSSDLKTYDEAPAFSTESPDRRWLLVQQPGSLRAFDLVRLDNKQDRLTTFELPEGIYTAAEGKHSLELVEWSTDNRHVVVKHIFATGSEFIMIDREKPQESVNVSRTFAGEAFNDVSMRGKKFDQLYLHNEPAGTLKAAELKSGLVTPLLTNVASYTTHDDDKILYAERGDGDTATVRLRDGLDTYTIRQLPASPSYALDMARFDGSWYMVIAAQSGNRAYLYKDAVDEVKRDPGALPAPMLALNVSAPEHVSFSANARFIAVQGGSRFGIYDAEFNRVHRYDIQLPAAEQQRARWMDGHRLTLENEGKLIVFDFDNANRQSLVSMQPGSRAFFNRDYTALYTVSPAAGNKDKSAILRTELKLKQ